MPLSRAVDNLSCEVWERIAFYAVASESTFLGPPSMICSLVLVSRLVNDHISYKKNHQLYARIFHFKFDFAAITRRLSERWRTSKCLTSELVKRFQTFKRMRSMDLREEDLWTVYLMMSENDGKNQTQLFEYAGLKTYLRTLVTFRATSHQFGWFKNKTLDSLTVWLLWATSERESIREEGNQSVFRDYLIGLLHSFLITGYKHSSTYAPDTFFDVPLCGNITIDDLAAWHWKPPPVSEIVHYSHRLRLACPVVAPAVVQSLTMQTDSFQTVANLPPDLMEVLPPNRAAAIAQGRTGPTAEDVKDFHLYNRINAFEKSDAVVDARYIEDLDSVAEELQVTFDGEENVRRGSVCHDEDWYRLVSCYDPWLGDMPLRGIVFRPGSLSGSWAGRSLQHALEVNIPDTVNGPPANPNVSIRHMPLYWELKEHHCMSPDDNLPAGNNGDWGDDVLNAWLPQGVDFKFLADAIEVFDPNTGHTARYQTFVPRNAATSPSTSANRKLPGSGISGSSDGEIAGGCAPELVFGSLNPARSLDPTLAIDDDEEFSDTNSQVSSGVSDILITGKTGEHYGDAWGHFTIHGRVRPWDGLVVLLRFPTDPIHDGHLGRWIFKGYLHHNHFVGLWRETSTPLESIGFGIGSGFVVYKT